MDDRGGEAVAGVAAWSQGGALAKLPGDPAILGDALRRAARSEHGLTCVESAETSTFIAYADLLDRARAIAGGLSARGLKPGDPVLFQIDAAGDFVSLLWACFLGGTVAVPVAVASVFSSDNANARKLLNIWTALGRPLIVAEAGAAGSIRASADFAGAAVARPDELAGALPLGTPPNLRPDDKALILFTSGSTGQPKGVVLEHRNLLAMAAGTAAMNGFTDADTTLNWMPLDHVGAISFLGILPVWLCASQVHVPTRLIAANPLLWLDLIARHRAAISWAPNFAFGLVNRLKDELREGRFDLSSMRFLVNAGEQVTAQTARTFLRILKVQGLPGDALRPAFGMSETCSGITWSAGLTDADLADERPFVSLGHPIPGAEIRITDEAGRILPEGEIGRFELRGASVTSGYHESPDRNREAFTADGWFRTGDLAFIRNGELHVTGREKEELVILGRNIPAHEIEAVVEGVEGVAPSYACAFAVRDEANGTERLVVAFSPASAAEETWPRTVVAIRRRLAEGMGLAAAHVIPLSRECVPKTGIGKIQRGRLKRAFEDGAFADLVARFSVAAPRGTDESPLSEIESCIAAIWGEVLALESVGRSDNFFDLGGHSLLLIKVHARLEALFGPVPLADLFAHSTVAALARHLSGRKETSPQETAQAQTRKTRIARRRGAERDTDIAVIGMACRFPGADDVDTFWRNLCDGIESIRRLDDGDLLRANIDPRSSRSASYVKASPVLNDAAAFDAGFFGFTPREAEFMDPQHRLFLECCWEAFEAAGYDPLVYAGAVGLYAGAGMNTYLLNNVMPNRARFDPQDDLRSVTLDSMGGFQLMVANDKDYLATRVSYKLNLRGPSLNLQTACSTGLVVIHQAVRSLISGECDMALAGTASVQSPEHAGHLHQEGMIVSADGHCRAFDARASGTIFGSGVGAVLLKRLTEAERDGDHILAVVKGSAVNNDGLRKVGYMAPSEAGESDVVREALDVAGVDARSVGYVEAHGTGTAIGDPIEVTSLTRAFRADTDDTGFCALGSVKTNVGHLQITSGIAGFMKAALALHHKRIPPLLHFESPNPAIAFERTPFNVNTTLVEWPQRDTPRRAGVNSLGIGGTNAHVILEEAPALARAAAIERPCHVLALSAKDDAALGRLIARYRDFVEANPGLPLEDVCYTANTGRPGFASRFTALFATRGELLAELRAAVTPSPRLQGEGWGEGLVGRAERSSQPDNAPEPLSTSRIHDRPLTPTLSPQAGRGGEGGIAFMFTGQGSQYAGMAGELYRIEPVFRAALDRCADILSGELDRPLLEILHADEAASPIHETAYAQPALFAVEYALARLWRSFGIAPAALIGHSVGEYAAACIAGVFSLEDGLRLIAARGRLMQALPKSGAMVAVIAEEAIVAAAVAPFADKVAVAAVNGTKNVVISGDAEAVASLVGSFEAQGIQTVALKTSHAFHSPLMRPALDAFRQVVESVTLRAPTIPLVSNVTGAVETALFADPAYWVRHIVEPVRFADGLSALRELGRGTFLEIGPKPVLAGLARTSMPRSESRNERGGSIVPLPPCGGEPERGVAGAGPDRTGKDERPEQSGFPEPSRSMPGNPPPCPPPQGGRGRSTGAIGEGIGSGGEGSVLFSLKPGLDDSRSILDAFAALWRRGHDVAWPALYDAAARRRIPLPLYPFARTRFWLEPPAAQAPGEPALHPLVHRRVALPGVPYALFETDLDPARLPLLGEHRVFGRIVMAGAGHLSMLLAAARLLTGRGAHAVTSVLFPEALVLSDEGRRRAQVQFASGAKGRDIRLVSFDPTDGPEPDHALHVTGTLAAEAGAPPAALDLDAIRARCPIEVPGSAIYRRLTERRIELGPAFSWIEALRRGEGEALFTIRLPDGVAVDPAYELHPGLIDSLLQPSLLVLGMGEGSDTHVPFALESFRVFGRAEAFPLTGHARRREAESGEVADIAVFDATGSCVAEVRGFEFRRVNPAQLLGEGGLHDAVHEIAWRTAQAAAVPAPLPAPRALTADPALLAQGMADLLDAVNGPHARRQADDLESLGLAYILAALRAADALPAPGAVLSEGEIARRLAVAPAFARLLRRLLRLLERDGRLVRGPAGFTDVACPDLPAPEDQIARIRRRHGAGIEAELTLLARAGERLGAILQGRADPLEALFPGGDLSLTTALYRDSAGFRALNTLVANAVEAMAKALPQDRPLRVIEIGAGTGATSHFMLRRLDPARSRYVFTDVSNLFLARARETFASFPFVEYRLLDIERDPAEQGFAEPFDIVVAANVLHATRSIRETLANVRKLLRPGGALVLLEVNTPTVPVDLTFGLLEGWWRFADHDLRPDYPLLSRAQWIEALRASGFSEAAAADTAIPTPGGKQSVILARADGAEPSAGAWAVVGEGAEALAGELQARGETCQVLAEADLAHGLAALPGLRGLVDLRARGATDAAAACAKAAALAQVLTASNRPVPLHLVTSGAQAVDGAGAAPEQAALWGFGRVLFREEPGCAGSLIDLDPQTEAFAPALADALLASGEREIALRGGRMLTPRLVCAPHRPGPEAAIRPDGAYLVTGGLGGLGLALARALVERGAQRLVLIGRSAPDPEARAALDALAAQGATVRVEAADVTDEVALSRILASEPSLRGVFHLAGVLHEAPIGTLTRDAVRRAMAAKVEGALLLDRLTAGLDHFVLFSSAASLLGLPGQGAYAAGNAALDALAHRRRARGEPALGVNWGRWSDIGMVAADGDRLAAQGHGAVSPERGLSLLFELMESGPAQAAILPMDWDRFLAGYGSAPPLLAEVRRTARSPAAPIPLPEAAPAADDGIPDYLARQLRQMLGLSAGPDRTRLLTELGLDSLMSIDLRNRIARDLGANLPLGALVDASLERLAADIAARLDLSQRLRLDDAPAADSDLEEEIVL